MVEEVKGGIEGAAQDRQLIVSEASCAPQTKEVQTIQHGEDSKDSRQKSHNRDVDTVEESSGIEQHQDGKDTIAASEGKPAELCGKDASQPTLMGGIELHIQSQLGVHTDKGRSEEKPDDIELSVNVQPQPQPQTGAHTGIVKGEAEGTDSESSASVQPQQREHTDTVSGEEERTDSGLHMGERKQQQSRSQQETYAGLTRRDAEGADSKASVSGLKETRTDQILAEAYANAYTAELDDKGTGERPSAGMAAAEPASERRHMHTVERFPLAHPIHGPEVLPPTQPGSGPELMADRDHKRGLPQNLHTDTEGMITASVHGKEQTQTSLPDLHTGLDIQYGQTHVERSEQAQSLHAASEPSVTAHSLETEPAGVIQGPELHQFKEQRTGPSGHSEPSDEQHMSHDDIAPTDVRDVETDQLPTPHAEDESSDKASGHRDPTKGDKASDDDYFQQPQAKGTENEEEEMRMIPDDNQTKESAKTTTKPNIAEHTSANIMDESPGQRMSTMWGTSVTGHDVGTSEGRIEGESGELSRTQRKEYQSTSPVANKDKPGSLKQASPRPGDGISLCREQFPAATEAGSHELPKQPELSQLSEAFPYPESVSGLAPGYPQATATGHALDEGHSAQTVSHADGIAGQRKDWEAGREERPQDDQSQTQFQSTALSAVSHKPAMGKSVASAREIQTSQDAARQRAQAGPLRGAPAENFTPSQASLTQDNPEAIAESTRTRTATAPAVTEGESERRKEGTSKAGLITGATIEDSKSRGKTAAEGHEVAREPRPVKGSDTAAKAGPRNRSLASREEEEPNTEVNVMEAEQQFVGKQGSRDTRSRPGSTKANDKLYQRLDKGSGREVASARESMISPDEEQLGLQESQEPPALRRELDPTRAIHRVCAGNRSESAFGPTKPSKQEATQEKEPAIRAQEATKDAEQVGHWNDASHLDRTGEEIKRVAVLAPKEGPHQSASVSSGVAVNKPGSKTHVAGSLSPSSQLQGREPIAPAQEWNQSQAEHDTKGRVGTHDRPPTAILGQEPAPAIESHRKKPSNVQPDREARQMPKEFRDSNSKQGKEVQRPVVRHAEPEPEPEPHVASREILLTHRTEEKPSSPGAVTPTAPTKPIGQTTREKARESEGKKAKDTQREQPQSLPESTGKAKGDAGTNALIQDKDSTQGENIHKPTAAIKANIQESQDEEDKKCRKPNERASDKLDSTVQARLKGETVAKARSEAQGFEGGVKPTVKEPPTHKQPAGRRKDLSIMTDEGQLQSPTAVSKEGRQLPKSGSKQDLSRSFAPTQKQPSPTIGTKAPSSARQTKGPLKEQEPGTLKRSFASPAGVEEMQAEPGAGIAVAQLSQRESKNENERQSRTEPNQPGVGTRDGKSQPSKAETRPSQSSNANVSVAEVSEKTSKVAKGRKEIEERRECGIKSPRDPQGTETAKVARGNARKAGAELPSIGPSRKPHVVAEVASEVVGAASRGVEGNRKQPENPPEVPHDATIKKTPTVRNPTERASAAQPTLGATSRAVGRSEPGDTEALLKPQLSPRSAVDTQGKASVTVSGYVRPSDESSALSPRDPHEVPQAAAHVDDVRKPRTIAQHKPTVGPVPGSKQSVGTPAKVAAAPGPDSSKAGDSRTIKLLVSTPEPQQVKATMVVTLQGEQHLPTLGINVRKDEKKESAHTETGPRGYPLSDKGHEPSLPSARNFKQPQVGRRVDEPPERTLAAAQSTALLDSGLRLGGTFVASHESDRSHSNQPKDNAINPSTIPDVDRATGESAPKRQSREKAVSSAGTKAIGSGNTQAKERGKEQCRPSVEGGMTQAAPVSPSGLASHRRSHTTEGKASAESVRAHQADELAPQANVPSSSQKQPDRGPVETRLKSGVQGLAREQEAKASHVGTRSQGKRTAVGAGAKIGSDANAWLEPELEPGIEARAKASLGGAGELGGKDNPTAKDKGKALGERVRVLSQDANRAELAYLREEEAVVTKGNRATAGTPVASNPSGRTAMMARELAPRFTTNKSEREQVSDPSTAAKGRTDNKQPRAKPALPMVVPKSVAGGEPRAEETLGESQKARVRTGGSEQPTAASSRPMPIGAGVRSGMRQSKPGALSSREPGQGRPKEEKEPKGSLQSPRTFSNQPRQPASDAAVQRQEQEETADVQARPELRQVQRMQERPTQRTGEAVPIAATQGPGRSIDRHAGSTCIPRPKIGVETEAAKSKPVPGPKVATWAGKDQRLAGREDLPLTTELQTFVKTSEDRKHPETASKPRDHKEKSKSFMADPIHTQVYGVRTTQTGNAQQQPADSHRPQIVRAGSEEPDVQLSRAHAESQRPGQPRFIPRPNLTAAEDIERLRRSQLASEDRGIKGNIMRPQPPLSPQVPQGRMSQSPRREVEKKVTEHRRAGSGTPSPPFTPTRTTALGQPQSPLSLAVEHEIACEPQTYPDFALPPEHSCEHEHDHEHYLQSKHMRELRADAEAEAEVPEKLVTTRRSLQQRLDFILGQFERCKDCGRFVMATCSHKCGSCKGRMCNECEITCSRCPQTHCARCATLCRCAKCAQQICPSCRLQCGNCHQVICYACRLVCRECKGVYCEECNCIQSCCLCQRLYCPQCRVACDHCNRIICSAYCQHMCEGCDTTYCTKCTDLCEKCIWTLAPPLSQTLTASNLVLEANQWTVSALDNEVDAVEVVSGTLEFNQGIHKYQVVIEELGAECSGCGFGICTAADYLAWNSVSPHDSQDVLSLMIGLTANGLASPLLHGPHVPLESGTVFDVKVDLLSHQLRIWGPYTDVIAPFLVYYFSHSLDEVVSRIVSVCASSILSIHWCIYESSSEYATKNAEDDSGSCPGNGLYPGLFSLPRTLQADCSPPHLVCLLLVGATKIESPNRFLCLLHAITFDLYRAFKTL